MTLPWICIAPKVARIVLTMRVADVLLTQNANQKRKIDQIDFTLDGITIDAAGLREVGQLMLQGRITVDVGNTGHMLSAAYTPHLNTMKIAASNRPPNDLWRAGIVHESVHALIDLRRVSTTVLNDETAAYLAEAVYIRAGGIAITPSDPKVALIFNTARRVVEAHKMHYQNGSSLSSKDCGDLQAAILAHPAYASVDQQPTSGLGID
jgi:hypothetical protein